MIQKCKASHLAKTFLFESPFKSTGAHKTRPLTSGSIESSRTLSRFYIYTRPCAHIGIPCKTRNRQSRRHQRLQNISARCERNVPRITARKIATFILNSRACARTQMHIRAYVYVCRGCLCPSANKSVHRE